MEIVDELMTPGCPQCAVKHLSAALYHAALYEADRRRPSDPPQRLVPAEAAVLLARAYINLGEVLIGYKSHLWFAVGMLQHAEEVAQRDCVPFVAEIARNARLMLAAGGLSPLQGVMQRIGLSGHLGHLEMSCAHFDEARRELPSWKWDPLPGNYERTIEAIRDEYFASSVDSFLDEVFKKDQEVAVDTSEEVAGEGGEGAMATKKAAKAKVDPKAAQAACKGGKAKKAACKGGKCKK